LTIFSPSDLSTSGQNLDELTLTASSFCVTCHCCRAKSTETWNSTGVLSVGRPLDVREASGWAAVPGGGRARSGACASVSVRQRFSAVDVRLSVPQRSGRPACPVDLLVVTTQPRQPAGCAHYCVVVVEMRLDAVVDSRRALCERLTNCCSRPLAFWVWLEMYRALLTDACLSVLMSDLAHENASLSTDVTSLYNS